MSRQEISHDAKLQEIDGSRPIPLSVYANVKEASNVRVGLKSAGSSLGRRLPV
jgi:hypothetical protein